MVAGRSAPLSPKCTILVSPNERPNTLRKVTPAYRIAFITIS